MKCLNDTCKYSIGYLCTNNAVLIGNERCNNIETELDCLACDLNETNKCADCCKDWNEDME